MKRCLVRTTGGKDPVEDLLNVRRPQLGKPHASDLREDVHPEDLVVSAPGARPNARALMIEPLPRILAECHVLGKRVPSLLQAVKQLREFRRRVLLAPKATSPVLPPLLGVAKLAAAPRAGPEASRGIEPVPPATRDASLSEVMAHVDDEAPALPPLPNVASHPPPPPCQLRSIFSQAPGDR